MKKIKHFIDIIVPLALSIVTGWIIALRFYNELAGWRYVVVIISLAVSLFVAYVVSTLICKSLVDKFKPKKKGGWE